jgi:pimeloyl-ACP methyl ester carboxylesterase
MMIRFVAIALFILSLGCAANAATSLSLEVKGGVTLDATYYAAKQPGPGLLFLNMCDPARDQSAWSGVATALADRGYHILTFDYRGFGRSGGKRPTNLRSIDEAMPYWREHWMSDVQTAYETLILQDGVETNSMGIAGASCGVFMGLEFAIANGNIKSLVLLGGPTEKSQRDQLAEMNEVPILLISGDESGPNEIRGTLEWSDEVFAASNHPDTRFLKYKTVTHGTNIFEHHPSTEQMVIGWFSKTLAVTK